MNQNLSLCWYDKIFGGRQSLTGQILLVQQSSLDDLCCITLCGESSGHQITSEAPFDAALSIGAEAARRGARLYIEIGGLA